MNAVSTWIRCRKCPTKFQPDLKSSRLWQCPHCEATIPNLKRHWRSVADVCILGLIFTSLFAVPHIRAHGIDLAGFWFIVHCVLLLLVIFLIYRAEAPWTHTAAKVLAWIVFIKVTVSNALIPLIQGQVFAIPLLIVYFIVIVFLLWLSMQTARYSATAPEGVEGARGTGE